MQQDRIATVLYRISAFPYPNRHRSTGNKGRKNGTIVRETGTTKAFMWDTLDEYPDYEAEEPPVYLDSDPCSKPVQPVLLHGAGLPVKRYPVGEG